MAREKLLDGALQIFQLIAGPGEHLPHLIEGVSQEALLPRIPSPYMQYQLTLGLVPVHGNIPVDESLWHL